MSLEPPNLDDRRFQDLVDDAMGLARKRMPDWLPAGPADPGVTLIEVAAWMTDQLIYRLNRVPDRIYTGFLDLLGVRLLPPVSARTDVTFWLASPDAKDVVVPRGTQISTDGSTGLAPIVFSTVEELSIVASSVVSIASSIGGEVRDHMEALERGISFSPFDNPPKPGDALLIGLSRPAPSRAIAIHTDCEIEGPGVQPDDPPLAWEAWDGDGWSPCEVDRDDTGGLCRAGEVVLHLPASHVETLIARKRAGWFRARVHDTLPGQAPYETSPRIKGVSGRTVGGSTLAVNASLITDEVVGTANGLPSGRYATEHSPIVATDEPLTVEIEDPGGWQQWHQVDSFAESGPEDLHFVVDAVKGEISFGPAVRLADGSMRNFGQVPREGAAVRIPAYWTGGGSRGNVMARTLTVVVDQLPAIGRVENRRPALEGYDGESIEAARVRGPLLLRTRDRAVTIEDFEEIARDAAADIARVRAVPVYGARSAEVRVLVVPVVPLDDVRVGLELLMPSESSFEAIVARLDEARLVGTNVVVVPPIYRGVSVHARIRARARANPQKLRDQALTAIYRYLHPTIGGPNSNGWPFGRPVLAGDINAVLQALPGTDLVEEVSVRGADPITGELGPETQRLLLEENALVFSYEHQVLIE